MSTVPRVSVVMGVFNSADTLESTLDSVLSQDVELELIVVDDGSTDGTWAVLEARAARDARLKIVRQENFGLTRALQVGCALAQGEFIARQDAGGDLSLPGRLRTQVEMLKARPDAVFATCGVRTVGPEGEFLATEALSESDIHEGLHTLRIPGLRGLCHGTAMFRRLAFERVGGYRSTFVVAQDIDLWLRLIELGACVSTPELQYEVRHSLGSISSRRRSEQYALAEIAMAGARARRAGLPEPVLPAPAQSSTGGLSPREERARFHYFVGSCLRSRDRDAARRHFLKAWCARPTHWRALVRLVTS